MSTSSDMGPDTRTTRRAAANRQSVIAAAREIVATQGAPALTMEAVAERADVAIATIYNRVGGRSALLVAVAEEAMRESRAYMDAAYSVDGAPEDRIRLVAAAWVRFARERPHEFRILVEPADEPEAVERLAALNREQNAKLAEAIRDGVRNGTVRASIDPDRAATTLWAAVNGVLALAWRPGSMQVSGDELELLLESFVDLAAQGLLLPQL